MAGQLVQNVRRRRDWIRTVEQLSSRQLRCRHESDRGGFVARDLAITARCDDRLFHLVVRRENFGCFSKVVSGLQGDFVCFNQLRVLFELGVDPIQGRIERSIVKPIQDSEREEVLAAIDLFARELHIALQGVSIQRRNRQLMHAITGERAVLDRIRFVGGVFEILLGEFVGVDDQRAAFFQIGKVDFQRCRIHRHQNVRLIARRANVVVGKIQLKTADARQAARWRANLSRKIGQRRDVVPHNRRRVRELRAGQLHTVARISGEANCYGVQFFELFVDRLDRWF